MGEIIILLFLYYLILCNTYRPICNNTELIITMLLDSLIDDQEKQLELDEIFAAAAFRLNAYNSVNKVSDQIVVGTDDCIMCI